MVVNSLYGTNDAPRDAVQPHAGVVKPQGENPEQDEERPLLSSPDSSGPKVEALTGVGTIIAVLLLGRD